MAKVTTTSLIDDLAGGEADETVGFALDGRLYSIDLSAENADKLREDFAPYVEAATPAGRVKADTNGGAHQPKTIRLPSDANAVRAWAAANGKQVSDRGRISAKLRADYEAAQV